MALRFTKSVSLDDLTQSYRREGDDFHIDVDSLTGYAVEFVDTSALFAPDDTTTITLSGDARVTMRDYEAAEPNPFVRRLVLNTPFFRPAILEFRVEDTFQSPIDSTLGAVPTGAGTATLTIRDNTDSTNTLEMTINVSDSNEIVLYYIPDENFLPRGPEWFIQDTLLERLETLAPNGFESIARSRSIGAEANFSARWGGFSSRLQPDFHTERFTVNVTKYLVWRFLDLTLTGEGAEIQFTGDTNPRGSSNLRFAGSPPSDRNEFFVLFDRHDASGSLSFYDEVGDTLEVEDVEINLARRVFPASSDYPVTVSENGMDTTTLKRNVPIIRIGYDGSATEAVSGALTWKVRRGLLGEVTSARYSGVGINFNTTPVDVRVSGDVTAANPRHPYHSYTAQNLPDRRGSFSGVLIGNGVEDQPYSTSYFMFGFRLFSYVLDIPFSNFATFSGLGLDDFAFLLDENNIPVLTTIPYRIVPAPLPRGVRSFDDTINHSVRTPFDDGSGNAVTGLITQTAGDGAVSRLEFYCLDGPDREYSQIRYKLDRVEYLNREDGIARYNTAEGQEIFDHLNWQKTRDIVFEENRFVDQTNTGDVGSRIRPVNVRGYNRGTNGITRYPNDTTTGGPDVTLTSVHIDSFFVQLVDHDNVTFTATTGDTLTFTVALSRHPVFGDMREFGSVLYDPVDYFLNGSLAETTSPSLTISGSWGEDDEDTRTERIKNASVVFSNAFVSDMTARLRDAGLVSPFGETLIVTMELPISVGIRSELKSFTLHDGTLRIASIVDLPGGTPRRRDIDTIYIPFTVRLREGDPPPDPEDPPPPPPDPTPQIASSVVANPNQLTVFENDAAYAGSPDTEGPPGFQPYVCAAISFTARPDVSWPSMMTQVDTNLPAFPSNSIPYGKPRRLADTGRFVQSDRTEVITREETQFPGVSFSRIWPDSEHPPAVRRDYGTRRPVPGNGILYWPRPQQTACGVRFPPVIEPHTFIGHLTRPVLTLQHGSTDSGAALPVEGIDTIAGGSIFDRPEGPQNFAVLQRGERTDRAFDTRMDGETDAEVIARAYPFHATLALAPKKTTNCLSGWMARAEITYREMTDYLLLGGQPWEPGPFEARPPSNVLTDVEIALAPAVSPSNPGTGPHPWWAGLHYSRVATVLSEEDDPGTYHIYVRTPDTVTNFGSSRRFLRQIGALETAPQNLGRIQDVQELGVIGANRYWLVMSGTEPLVLTAEPRDQFVFTRNGGSALRSTAIDSPEAERPGLVLAIMAGGQDMSGPRVVARVQIPSTLDADNTLETVTADWILRDDDFNLMECRPVLFAPFISPIGTRFVVVEFGVRIDMV